MKSINRAVMRYQLTTSLKYLLCFYGTLTGVIVLMELLVIRASDSVSVSVGNMELSSMIFLMVAGINSLKQDLKFFSANGLTRKQLFKSVVLTALFASLVMVGCDSLLGWIYRSFRNYIGFQNGLYPLMYRGEPQILSYPFQWMLYFFIYMLGFMIANVYYKLTKLGKILVSVCVPAFLLIGFPYIDAMYFDFTITVNIFDAIMKVMGIYPVVNAWYGIGCLLGLTVLIAALSYLMMRRAVLKEA